MEVNTYRRGRNGVAVHTHTDKRSEEDVGNGEQLLPGIPNEVTLDLIVPKLPWTAFHVLSCASRCWKEAIQTKQVYEARVRAHSTEALIVHIHSFNRNRDKKDTLVLYSTREKCCYQLPQIPFRGTGIEDELKCIVLDGKLYVLGRRHVREDGLDDSIGEVYVLDLAGCRGWKPCASMLHARSQFGCGVLDGKIYVFEGAFHGGISLKRLPQSEVYDIQENAWYPIRSMPTIAGRERRYQNLVATVGKELFLYGSDLSTFLAYNPAKNEWRLVDFFPKELWALDRSRWHAFVKDDKFYSFSSSGIDVYDVKQTSWINRHTHSVAFEDSRIPVSMLAVRDEILLTITCVRPGEPFLRLFQCKGFDTEKKELVWQTGKCTEQYFRFRCSIEL